MPKVWDRFVKRRSSDCGFAGGFPQIDGAVGQVCGLCVNGENLQGDVSVSLKRRQNVGMDRSAVLSADFHRRHRGPARA